MTAVPRRFAGLVLSVSVAAASVGFAAPAQAVPGDDVTITESGDKIAYVDEGLANAPTDTVRGTLRVAFVERRSADESPEVELDFTIVTARGGNVPIELAEDLPTSAANGTIEAEVVDDGSAAPQVAEAVVRTEPDEPAPRPVPSEHRAYIVTLAKTGGFATTSSIDATYTDSILKEWTTEAEGAITDFSVADVRSLPSSSTPQSVAALCAMDDPDRSWGAAVRLFPGVSFDLDTGNHLIVLTSKACVKQPLVGIGVGEVGTSIRDGGALSVLADPSVEKSTVVHELGHNFGLMHANAKECSTTACGSQEYFDVYSVMGFSVDRSDPPALDSIFRDALGIAQLDEVSVLRESQPVLRPMAPRGSTSGRRAIEVIDPVTDESFWIEYRDGSSRDNGSAYATSPAFETDAFRFTPGVTITQSGPDGSIDLLAHPRGSVSNGALIPGESWRSPSGAVAVTAEAIDYAGSTMAARVDIDTARPVIKSGGVAGAARVDVPAAALPGDGPTGVGYRWSVNGRYVASGSTYVPKAADRGLPLTVAYTRPDRYPSTSAPVVVGSGRFVAAPAPTISGTSRVAATLTAKPGTWSPAATLRYQWYANGSAISGARSSTYKIATAHKGKQIKVKVTGNRAGYAATSKTSAPTVTVATNTFRAPAPSIRGTRKVGSTLTALTGTWSPRPTTFRYQWFAGSTAIRGATGKTYRPGASRAGKKMRVKIVGSRSGYVTATRYSPYTATIKR